MRILASDWLESMCSLSMIGCTMYVLYCLHMNKCLWSVYVLYLYAAYRIYVYFQFDFSLCSALKYRSSLTSLYEDCSCLAAPLFGTLPNPLYFPQFDFSLRYFSCSAAPLAVYVRSAAPFVGAKIVS